MIKTLIKLLKAIKCKIFICCESKCSINENNEINISSINNDETSEAIETNKITHE